MQRSTKPIDLAWIAYTSRRPAPLNPAQGPAAAPPAAPARRAPERNYGGREPHG